MTRIIRVLDVETTGLDPAVDKVVEVATVDLLDDDGEVSRGRMWSSLVAPGAPIPPEASAVHHITDDMVAGAAKLEDAIAEATEGAPSIYAAHNARFDRPFVDPGLSWRVDWICTYKVALWLWPECPSHSNQCLRYWLKLKLADASLTAPHRALGDAYVTAAILRRMLRTGATVEQMVKVSGEPAVLPRFRFGAHAGKPLAEVPDSYLQWVLSEKGIKDEDVRFTAYKELNERRDR